MEKSSPSDKPAAQQPSQHAHTTQPALTWKSFGISAIIILCIYLVVFSVVDQPETKTSTKEKLSPLTSATYEYKNIDGNPGSSNKMLSIPINGIILTDKGDNSGFFSFLQGESATYGYSIKDELKRAAMDPEIKAVILEINSPGGTVSGANAIAEGVNYFREVTKKPVYAHILDLGASGAYWSAASTDYIVAEMGGTVGSIGVIMGPFRTYNKVTAESTFGGGVQTDGGIDYTYITAGQYKDTGSPYRKMTDDEQKHWQAAINNSYDDFVNYISARRKIPRETIITQVKALPYDTKRALQLGLIDMVGSREVAQELLAEKAKISDYSVVQENQTFGFLEDLFGKAEALQPKQSAACKWCNQPLVLYDGSYSWVK